VIPAFRDVALVPKPNHLPQKFSSSVHAQAGHAFQVAVGENSHGSFSPPSANLQELSGSVRIGRRRYGSAKKA